MFNLNEQAEYLNRQLGIPVSLSFYDGDDDSYVVYTQTQKDSPLYGDDGILGCVVYYDFDVYSKNNYLTIVTNLINILTNLGWTYVPTLDSPDFYERDTKYYHKTICMCKEVQNG